MRLEGSMILVSIIGGVFVLTALSIAGVYLERQQKRRFEKEASQQ